MTNLLDYKNLKKAKIIVKDLEYILKLLNLTTKGIDAYKKYTPVRNILSEIHENQQYINIYIKKYKEVIKNKGQISNEKS